MAREFRDFVGRTNLAVNACNRTRIEGEEERPAEPPEDTMLPWEMPNSLAGWERAQDRSDAGCTA